MVVTHRQQDLSMLEENHVVIVASVLGHMMEMELDDAFNGSWMNTNTLGRLALYLVRLINAPMYAQTLLYFNSSGIKY
jgi:hypothetical protein